MSSSVILAASLFDISCGKTGKHINRAETHTHVTNVGVGKIVIFANHGSYSSDYTMLNRIIT